jgi:hypothetical protein
MNAYDEYGLYMANKHVIKLKSQTQPYYKLCSAIYTTSINNEIILYDDNQSIKPHRFIECKYSYHDYIIYFYKKNKTGFPIYQLVETCRKNYYSKSKNIKKNKIELKSIGQLINLWNK